MRSEGSGSEIGSAEETARETDAGEGAREMQALWDREEDFDFGAMLVLLKERSCVFSAY